MKRLVRLLLRSLMIAALVSPIITSNSFAQTQPADRPIGDKWALVVGVSEFPLLDTKLARSVGNAQRSGVYVPSHANSLTYTVKDAVDMTHFLKDQAGFKPDHVKLLLNSDATSDNVRYYLGEGWLRNVVKPDDLVVLYFSSHGFGSPYQNQQGDNYIITFDFDPDDMEHSGLPMQQLGQIVKNSIKSDRVVMIADTCFAGNLATRAVPDVMGVGQISVSACSPAETSMDDPYRQGGLFTSHLLVSLKKNQGMLKKSFDEARVNTIRDGRIRFMHEQHPITDYSRWSGGDVSLYAKPTSDTTSQTQLAKPIGG